MIPAGFHDLWSTDRAAQNAAYRQFMAATAGPVDWAYVVWDDVVAHLAASDNHDRAIAGQLLCNLALSDPEQRIRRDWDKLLAVTEDTKFVTARHVIQSLWKVGLSEALRPFLLDATAQKFAACASHKNHTLIRYDLLEGLRDLADATGDQTIRPVALNLIQTESDVKYANKYSKIWK
ncbi:MAG: hypothetical protein ACOH2N_13900 [Devosia sp.]